MDIHVDVSCRYGEIYEIRHLCSHGYHTFVGIHNRLVEIRVLHISSVDKEILLCTLLFGRFRLTNKPLDRAHRSFHLHWQKVMVETLSKYVHDTLPQCTCPKRHHLLTIAMHSESYIGIDQCYTFEGGHYVVKFSGVAL